MDPRLWTVSEFLQQREVRQQNKVQSPIVMPDGDSFLEWVTWNNSLPNNSVSIYNYYVGRTDYVCKYKCHAGFYSPSKGTYCHYANAKKEYTGFPFEVLVNKDNFEILEWKDDSRGSVPKNSVRICPGENIYVGKNKYGLGKVIQNKAFYLPWKGSEYSYNDYQVLTISENIVRQQIDNVRYTTRGSEMIKYPTEIMRVSTIKNFECHPVLRTDTLSKTYDVTQRWDFGLSIIAGVRTFITVGVPFIADGKIEISFETTFQYSMENTVTESITDTVSVQLTAPPNTSCSINMMRYKYKLTIPFTARLRRTYGNREIHTTSITGTYSGVQVGKVEVLLDRCKPLGHSQPCA
ncbi:natterin-4-like [Labrus mixtus]|uniref:natterin-4-like n=1 Tax=Labrus mixtus TaxID=508554 RepID=UPI0029C00320|nr:natterin-4-like [Labrus mixtus]